MKFSFFNHITNVNRSLIFLDWGFFFGWSMLSPVLAIFVTRDIGGSISQAGYVVATAWITRSILQIPISIMLDRKEGERDEFLALVSSIALAGFIAIGYFFARHIATVYALQMAQGLQGALYGATWPAMFSRHLNHGKVSFQWSLDTAGISVMTGLAGGIGGYLAETYGFRVLFLIIAAFSFGALIPLFGARELLKKMS